MMDERFEALVRAHADLAPDTPIDPDVSFSEIGMTSIATVQLLIELEEAYQIEFPDDLLVPATFVSPGSLHNALMRVTGGVSPNLA